MKRPKQNASIKWALTPKIRRVMAIAGLRKWTRGYFNRELDKLDKRLQTNFNDGFFDYLLTGDTSKLDKIFEIEK